MKLLSYLKLTVQYYRDYGMGAVVKKYKNKLRNSSIFRKRLYRTYVKSILPTEEERKEQSSHVFSKDICFSVLVPLYNTPKEYLLAMIESVEKQTYGKWQLCLADASDSGSKECRTPLKQNDSAVRGRDFDSHQIRRFCEEKAKVNPRISYQKLETNGGISANTNAALAMATGNYMVLLDHDDLLHESALYELACAIEKQDADFLYTDEAVFQNSIENIVLFHFKPDFAPDNLLSNNYITHLSCFAKSLLAQTGGFRKEFDGSQDHDLILRLTGAARHIVHIPKVLYFWRSHPASVASDLSAKTYAIEAGRAAVQDYLDTKGERARVESSTDFPTIYRIRYEIFDSPKVSIVIPNKDHVKDLSLCLESIEKKTSYGNYEILVVENNSTQEETWNYYETIKKCQNVSVVTFESSGSEANSKQKKAPKQSESGNFVKSQEQVQEKLTYTFNYSALNNFGVSRCSGEYILFLNNDTEIISPDWIQELLMYAQRSDVGAVGAKLFFANGWIQHGGIFLGLGGVIAADAYQDELDVRGYMGRLCYVQDVTAVTGACMMVKRTVFEQVGGFEEALPVAYNDVDFCLKLHECGYLNIMTPQAQLFHYESKSRGRDEQGSAKARLERDVTYMREKWGGVIEKGDPYYNPNFSRTKVWRLKERERI
ncbi:glycosyl transferase family 2 [Clostridia bacterium]|nr:glycosyl transferase family 2 [Clostridia bacterium]